MGRTEEKGFVERRFDLRGAGGTTISCPVIVVGVSCMEMRFGDGKDLSPGSSEKFSFVESRIQTKGVD